MSSNRAVLLAGDHFHDPAIAFAGVGQTLDRAGLEVIRTTDYASVGETMLAQAHLLVIHRDGIELPEGRQGARVPWMQPEQEEAIERFVLGGGGFLALHNAGWGYPYENGYRRTLGGYYIGHPPLAEFAVDVVNREHPVTEGVTSYRIVDEQHWLHWDWERVTPLLLSRGQGTDGRQSVSGWAHEYGHGRVAYLPHGHTMEALGHPMNQRLMSNAVNWLLRPSELGS